MSANLVALSEGPNLPLDRPVLLVGRHAECDLQLNSGKVSRRHCVIATVNGKLVIRDLGSTNGVRINGEPVDEGFLYHGDEVVIGNFRYRVELGDDPTGRTARPDSPAEAPVHSGTDS
ncbi:MAG: FHA domain-containing protein [Gemmataceae bacterium]|nr:FHA domain-containing protein [Gemmataceae bacterium]